MARWSPSPPQAAEDAANARRCRQPSAKRSASGCGSTGRGAPPRALRSRPANLTRLRRQVGARCRRLLANGLPTHKKHDGRSFGRRKDLPQRERSNAVNPGNAMSGGLSVDHRRLDVSNGTNHGLTYSSAYLRPSAPIGARAAEWRDAIGSASLSLAHLSSKRSPPR